jgi:hypothetical protein
MLEKLRGLLASSGKLSQFILAQSAAVPHPMTYRKRFGSLRQAFELIGYRMPSRHLGISEQSRRRHHLQEILIAEIETLFPNQARVRFVRNRPVFMLGSGMPMPISICYCYETPGLKKMRWFLTVPRRDRHLTTLICLSNLTSDGFGGFYVVHGIEMGTKCSIKGYGDPLLQRAQRLNSLAQLGMVVGIDRW